MNKILAILPLLAVLCVTPLSVMGEGEVGPDTLTVTAEQYQDEVLLTVSGVVYLEGDQRIGVLIANNAEGIVNTTVLIPDENGFAEGRMIAPEVEGTYLVGAWYGIMPTAVTTPNQGGTVWIDIVTPLDED